MSDFPKISEAELAVMKVIWEKYPVSTNDIADLLANEMGWNVRTVHTLIARLEKKGAISHTKNGRIFVYTPLVNKTEYISMESKSFLDKFYNGAINKMVMNFMQNNMLSDKDIRELRDILDKKE